MKVMFFMGGKPLVSVFSNFEFRVKRQVVPQTKGFLVSVFIFLCSMYAVFW